MRRDLPKNDPHDASYSCGTYRYNEGNIDREKSNTPSSWEEIIHKNGLMICVVLLNVPAVMIVNGLLFQLQSRSNVMDISAVSTIFKGNAVCDRR